MYLELFRNYNKYDLTGTIRDSLKDILASHDFNETGNKRFKNA